ncbi:hypothetical protein CRENBAI_019125, partial [Crenichthys baileyi]
MDPRRNPFQGSRNKLLSSVSHSSTRPPSISKIAPPRLPPVNLSLCGGAYFSLDNLHPLL